MTNKDDKSQSHMPPHHQIIAETKILTSESPPPQDPHTIHTVVCREWDKRKEKNLALGLGVFKVGCQSPRQLMLWTSHPFPNGNTCSSVGAAHGRL